MLVKGILRFRLWDGFKVMGFRILGFRDNCLNGLGPIQDLAC